MEYVAIIVLGLVIIYQGFANYKEREQHKEEKAQLLDRIMSRDYGQFVQAELAKKHVDKPMTDSELEKYEDILPVN